MPDPALAQTQQKPSCYEQQTERQAGRKEREKQANKNHHHFTIRTPLHVVEATGGPIIIMSSMIDGDTTGPKTIVGSGVLHSS